MKAAERAVLALKPVVVGVPAIDSPDFAASDTALLLAAQGLEVTPATVEACSAWRFEAPLSPDMAAAAEGRTVEFDVVLGWCRRRIAGARQARIVLIEGVGELMSPIASDTLNLDLIKTLGCKVLLVTGSYLGALTHTLTAIETLRAHGVVVLAVVLNESADSSVGFNATHDTLLRYAGGAPIVAVRRGVHEIAMDLD